MHSRLPSVIGRSTPLTFIHVLPVPPPPPPPNEKKNKKEDITKPLLGFVLPMQFLGPAEKRHIGVRMSFFGIHGKEPIRVQKPFRIREFVRVLVKAVDA